MDIKNIDIRYALDRPTRRLSLMISVVLALIFAAMWFIPDAYMRAWSIGMLLAIVLLYILSIPRFIRITPDALEIHCVVELTRIPREDIRSITSITRQEIKPLLLLGSYGFFGYYGYFASLNRWQTLKIYASNWQNLLLIEDIYETKYIVSCQNPSQLISLV